MKHVISNGVEDYRSLDGVRKQLPISTREVDHFAEDTRTRAHPTGISAARRAKQTKRVIRQPFKLAIISAIIVLPAISGAIALHIESFSFVPMLLAGAMTAFGLCVFPRVKLPTSVFASFIFYLFLVLLGTVVSLFTTSLEFAVRGATGLLLIVCTAFTVSVLIGSEPRESQIWLRSRSMMILVGLVLVQSLWALRQSLIGFTPSETVSYHNGPSTFSVGGILRSTGLFTINQEFGMFAGTLIPAIVVFFMMSRNRRGVYFAVLAILMVALILHLGRTPLVGAVSASFVAIIAYAPFRSILVRVLAGVGGLLLIIGIAFVWLSGSDDARAQDAFARIATFASTGTDISVVARTDIVWANSLSLIENNPFGLGVGSAGPTSATLPWLAPAGPMITDQGYLMIGVQLGWVGIAAFVWLLISMTIWLMRATSVYARASAMLMLSLAIAMLATQYWAMPGPGVTLGAVLGLGISAAASEIGRRNLTSTLHRKLSMSSKLHHTFRYIKMSNRALGENRF